VVGCSESVSDKIQNAEARRIWDSRGRPTIEVEVTLSGGAKGRGIAPAGASRGSNEALELRDGGDRLEGYDVQAAVRLVKTEIAGQLTGMHASDQATIDAALIELDGTPNKSRLGGNAMIATSIAVLQAAAAAAEEPLWRYLARGRPVSIPLPEIQIFGGGAHAGRRVDIQDFLVMPIEAQDFDEAMVMTSEVYRAAGRLMEQKGPAMGVADEGGWWPNFKSNEEALDTLARAIRLAGFDDGRVVISLDIAASEFGRNGRYRLALEGRDYDSEEWSAQLLQWLATYPIMSIEDPMAEDDPAGMIAFMRAAGTRVQVVGDDYLVTDAKRVTRAQAEHACNAVLIKPNQAGTITEAHAALVAAQSARWGTIVSARSGETEDVTIAHLAVGWNAGQLKVGSFTRSERMAKWNEVLRIEQSFGKNARYAGAGALPLNKDISL
jgi:enolase